MDRIILKPAKIYMCRGRGLRARLHGLGGRDQGKASIHGYKNIHYSLTGRVAHVDRDIHSVCGLVDLQFR